jgi:hypothetical protein
MNCPICKKADIGPNPLVCPQCEMDLRVFQNIEQLRHSIVPDYFGIIKKNTVILVTLAILCLFSFAVIYLIVKNINNTKYIVQLESQIKLNKNATTIDKSIRFSNNNLNKHSFFSYKVKKRDSLWDISKFFYGTGNKYLKVMEANSLISYDLIIGQILLIPND